MHTHAHKNTHTHKYTRTKIHAHTHTRTHINTRARTHECHLPRPSATQLARSRAIAPPRVFSDFEERIKEKRLKKLQKLQFCEENIECNERQAEERTNFNYLTQDRNQVKLMGSESKPGARGREDGNDSQEQAPQSNKELSEYNPKGNAQSSGPAQYIPYSAIKLNLTSPTSGQRMYRSPSQSLFFQSFSNIMMLQSDQDFYKSPRIYSSMSRIGRQQNNNLMLKHRNEQKRQVVSCIFKVFDDIRQDCLALQIIQIFQGIFKKLGLDLQVFPYKTIANRTSKDLNLGGIIECVKDNAISRDQLGKTNQCSLYDHFINKFGGEDSKNFQIARQNFIKSQSAYSIISYILQIKDRHNGNILINENGFIVHIDFGFIFDISPAHNMKFERADFKLTREMIQIMGGSKQSEAFQHYINLTIKGFLAVRQFHDHIFNVVNLMTSSSLPCFKQRSMRRLRKRFKLNLNDINAAKYMRGRIEHAYDNLNTRLYDDIQYIQQGIYR